MTQLHDLLDRATDRLTGDPDLAARAVAAARLRRRVRRGAFVTGIVGVVAVVALVGLDRSHSDSAPPVTPGPSAPTASTSPNKLTQPAWDQRHVDRLPQAAPGVAAVLPSLIEPPASATPLAHDPVDAAVLALRSDDSIVLLTADGAWRSVPPPTQGASGAVLSADGSRLAVDTVGGVTAWNLRAGTRTHISFPSARAPSEGHWWAWVDDSTLLFHDPGTGSWLVNTATDEVTRVPYPGDALSWAVDPDGAVLESTDFGTREQLVDWAGGQARRIDTGADGLGVGRLTSLVADADTIAANADGASGSGPALVVIDRGDLEPRHVLPLVDHQGDYSGGKAPVVAVLADQTVLVQVPVFGDEPSWRLVAWDPRSGGLTRVARGVGPVPASYAAGLLG